VCGWNAFVGAAHGDARARARPIDGDDGSSDGDDGDDGARVDARAMASRVGTVLVARVVDEFDDDDGDASTTRATR